MRLANRRGVSLAELLVAMTMLGIIGLALTKLVTSQSRFFEGETSRRSARTVARSAMNIMLSELRMVQDSGGVEYVSANGKIVTLVVPYRYGMLCGSDLTASTVSMLPADSSTLAQAVYAGYAWRNSTTGRYTLVYPGAPLGGDAPAAASDPAKCTGSSTGQAQLRTVSVAGRTGNLLDIKPPIATTVASATPIFFWQRITYEFHESAIFPGQFGLFRRVSSGPNEEIMAPFDSSARFRFFQLGDDTSRVTPPAVALIRGLDIIFASEASRNVAGETARRTAPMRTSVFFKNTRVF